MRSIGPQSRTLVLSRTLARVAQASLLHLKGRFSMSSDQLAGLPASQRPTYDLLIRGGSVVSVFTGETFPADVAIQGETIVAVLPPDTVTPYQIAGVLDAPGLIIAPGFIHPHMH